MSPGCWQLFSFQSTFKVFKPALDGNLSKEAEVKSSCRCLSIFGCVVLNAFCRNSWTESIWGSLTASDWSEYTGTEWLVIRSWDLRPFGVLKTRPDGPDEFTKCAIFWLKHVQPFEEKWVVSALSCWDEARSSNVTSGRISLSIQVCQPPNQNSHAKVDGIKQSFAFVIPVPRPKWQVFGWTLCSASLRGVRVRGWDANLLDGLFHNEIRL